MLNEDRHSVTKENMVNMTRMPNEGGTNAQML